MKEIEWAAGQDLVARVPVLVPTNFVYCPYIPLAGAAAISMSSTNGAAAGRDLEHATRAGLLECIERDAFAFYSRTGACVIGIDPVAWPEQVSRWATRNPWAAVTAVLLPTPFESVSVAQVTISSGLETGTRTSRGTGAAFSEWDAVVRAASECIQMYHSLSDTGDDPAAADDMRDIWRTGESKRIWPEYFQPLQMTKQIKVVADAVNSDFEIYSILRSAKKQGVSFFRHTIWSSRQVAMVKCIMSSNSVADAMYFKNSNRIIEFAKLTHNPQTGILYDGPLFM